jgi:multidrug efflux system membrane fusion protein
MKPADRPNQEAPRVRRRWLLAAGSFILVAILAATLWPSHATVRPVAAAPVNAGHPTSVDFPIYVGSVGTVTPLNRVDVKVRVDGQLQHVAFTEGQDVKTGQLLAQLDQGPLAAQLGQAQAAQRKDQAALENARVDLARYTKLAAIGGATSQAVDTAKSQVAVLAATVAADAEQVKSDRLQLSFTTLNAPFSGRVGAREADIGAIVHPGDTTGIVTVTQMEPVTVQFSVPQDVLPELLAQQAKGPLAVSVTTRSGTTPLADGTLVFIDSTVDATTGQIKLKASFTNRDRKLWPGELVNAQVLVRTELGRLAVPSRAIVNTRTGPQVFTVNANGMAQLKPVWTGATVDGMTQILSGISPADLVVFDGQSRLNPGIPVAASKVATVARAPGNPDSAANQNKQDSLDNPS